jgi:predicted transcriptional regulator
MNKLKQKMQSVGITAYRLAQLSGVSQATISRMKKGNNCTKKTWDAVWEVLNNKK